jgi:predicted phosphodiesterase
LKNILVYLVLFFYLTTGHGQNICSQWSFIPGKKDEKLNKFELPSFQNAETVVLPHRIEMPDRALWYRGYIALRGDICLEVKADDGAQLWQDGVRIYANAQGAFPLQMGRDTSILVIRVLNNAMKGGLSSIRMCSYGEQENGVSHLENAAPENLSATVRVQEIRDKGRCVVQVWGDSQGGWDVFQRICKLMEAQEADVNIGVGDLVSRGIQKDEWLMFSKLIEPLGMKRPVLLLPGNHDYDGYADYLRADNYLSYCRAGKSTSYFFHQEKQVAFLALDPNCNFPLAIDQKQQSWADSIFCTHAWKDARWKVLLIHQVPYGAGWAGYSGEQFLRSYLDSVAKLSDFDLVIGGHIHDFERVVKNIHGKHRLFIVTGGAGGNLEPEENDFRWKMDAIRKEHHFCTLTFQTNELQMSVSNQNGQIIDQFKYNKDE